MAIIGVLSTIAFFLIGLPGALFVGLLAGLLNFVPYVGPIVSFVPPLLLALTIGPLAVVLVAIAYAGVQFAESYLVTPLIMERAASLHPATVIATVTIGVLVDELWFRRLEPEGQETARETSSGAG